MSHESRIMRGPNGELLEDTRSSRRITTDSQRLTALFSSLDELLPPETLSTVAEEEKTSYEKTVERFDHIREIFTGFSDGDGLQHDMDESTKLGPEEKTFLIYAASRSSELFLALTQGQWGRVMSLLIEAGKFVTFTPAQNELRSRVVMKLGMPSNRLEDDIVSTAITYDTEAEALSNAA